jgi:hypothetical protein
MTKPIQFRPHHFLCSVAYQGMGYSKAFVANYDRIAEQIRKHEETKIQVVRGSDSICSRCPHNNVQSSTCSDEATSMKLDRAHSAILDLQDQEIFSFREAKQKIKERMSLELFYEACRPCEWQSLGHCEAALKKLLVEE